jgi:hypothetical protein
VHHFALRGDRQILPLKDADEIPLEIGQRGGDWRDLPVEDVPGEHLPRAAAVQGLANDIHRRARMAVEVEPAADLEFYRADFAQADGLVGFMWGQVKPPWTGRLEA